MKKKLLFISIYFVFLLPIHSQIAGGIPNIKGVPPTTPSPNSASLGTYGQIPVSLFNGLPNVNIPLYNYDLINIDISYHPSTVKPEHHSGWTGLGWNLNVGGSITRIVNGGVDEVVVPNFTDKEVFSYYSNPTILDRSNWYNQESMNYYYKNTDMIHAQGDEFIPYPYPDEFVFNFNGISGSFFYNHKGKWVVKSNQHIHLKIKEFTENDYKLDVKLGKKDYSVPEVKNLKRIFYGFEITDQNGIRYIFGKTQNSIEFSLMGFKSDEYNSNYVANTWHLTEIISPNNDKITLEYDRDNSPVFTQSISTRINYINTGSQQQKISNPKAYSLNGFFISYLKKIKFKQGEILFNKSLSNELKYDFRNIDQIIGNDFQTEFLREYLQNYKYNLHWYKLDNIQIRNFFSDKIEEIKFKYTQDSSKRLFLNSLVKYDSADTKVKKHLFKYNSTSLPDYNSQKIDHWGFYNGNNFFENNYPSDNYFYSKSQYTGYYNSREPNFNYAKAGILEEIIYPTGGKTNFIYEPNTYSSLIEKSLSSRFNIRNVGLNKITGGLRIKEIISNAQSPLTPPISKKYFYVKDYKNNNLTSSGVLAGSPNYMEDGPTLDGVVDYWFWNSYSIEPMCFTNGNHVTYSKVIEQNQDGSYKEYTFSNHDNETYRDRVPNAVIIYNNEQWKYFPYNNKSLERGKLLSEKFYDNDDNIVREIKNTYTNIPDSEDNSIRSLYINSRQFGKITNEGPFTNFSGVAFGHNVSAFTIYKYYNYLSKTETIDYINGLSTNIVEKYKRNNYRQLSSKDFLSSKNIEYKIKYKYPNELLSTNWPLMGDLVYENRISEPIFTFNYRNGNLIKTDAIEYGLWASGGRQPRKILKRKGTVVNTDLYKKETFLVDVEFLKYDEKRNVVEAKKKDGTRVLYIWGYNKTKLIAKIENCIYSEVDDFLDKENDKRISFLQDLSNKDKDKASEKSLRDWLNKLREIVYDRKENATVTTYTYDPLIGVTSITDPRGETVYYHYDAFNRLEYVKDAQGNILKEYKYKYKN